MRIGILTFHYALNQGAVLQAYALQTYLEKRGHYVEFIDYHPDRKYTWRDYVAKSFYGIYNKLRDVYYGKKYSKLHDFSKVLNYADTRYYTFDELKRTPPEYDIYIVGSDQIWHFPRFLNKVYLMNWLPTGANVVSYAASLGQNTPPIHLEQEFVGCLLKFKHLSIRESSGAKYVRRLLKNREVIQCVDPTMLLNADDYKEIEEQVRFDKRYLVSYILTPMEPSHYDVLRIVCKQNNCKLLNLRNPDTCVYLRGYKNKIVTPYQWLSFIKNASVVICSSFHAVVFSLIYHKPFIVLQSTTMRAKGGNLRVLSLLEPFCLTHRCVYGVEGTNIKDLLAEKIDWQVVDDKIKELSIASENYLKTVLDDINCYTTVQ